ncbi:hypothetical protein D1007_26098 [Hordeum vulgare]|nr:hypothetical protein D1007_26098 [Hordeum vulgare]
MAPAGKKKPEKHGPAPASLLLDCSLSKDTDLVPVLPWTTAECSEHGRTLICLTAEGVAREDIRLELGEALRLSVVPVLERFSRDISAKRQTGGMILKEFLAQRFAPIQAHSRPLWEYRASDDELRLRSRDLTREDMSRVFEILLGGDPGNLPEALGPLYRRDDRTNLVAVMPVFNERGLLPAEGSGLVEVPSSDTSGEGARRRQSMTVR